MPEQQHCGLERDDSHRHAPQVYDLMQEEEPRKSSIIWWRCNLCRDPPLTPLTVLLWVLPLATIVAGGWIIVARTRRRVRIERNVLADAIPAAGPRAGWGAYVPGVVMALVVAAIGTHRPAAIRR